MAVSRIGWALTWKTPAPRAIPCQQVGRPLATQAGRPASLPRRGNSVLHPLQHRLVFRHFLAVDQAVSPRAPGEPDGLSEGAVGGDVPRFEPHPVAALVFGRQPQFPRAEALGVSVSARSIRWRKTCLPSPETTSVKASGNVHSRLASSTPVQIFLPSGPIHGVSELNGDSRAAVLLNRTLSRMSEMALGGDHFKSPLGFGFKLPLIGGNVGPITTRGMGSPLPGKIKPPFQ